MNIDSEKIAYPSTVAEPGEDELSERSRTSDECITHILRYQSREKHIATLAGTQYACVAQNVSIHQPCGDSKIFRSTSIHL